MDYYSRPDEWNSQANRKRPTRLCPQEVTEHIQNQWNRNDTNIQLCGEMAIKYYLLFIMKRFVELHKWLL